MIATDCCQYFLTLGHCNPTLGFQYTGNHLAAEVSGQVLENIILITSVFRSHQVIGSFRDSRHKELYRVFLVWLKTTNTVNVHVVGSVFRNGGIPCFECSAVSVLLSVRKHALGALHPSTARIYTNIGCIYVEFNEFREAHQAFEAALDSQRRTLCYGPRTMAR